MELDLRSDIRLLAKDAEKVHKSIVPTATVQALNRTVKGVATDAIKNISKITGIKQKEVRPQLVVSKTTKAKLTASVDAKRGKARNLINFVNQAHRKPGYFSERRRTKSGRRGKVRSVGVKARAWGKTKVYRGSFIGTGKTSNATLVFTRQSNGKLKALKGPSIRTEFNRKDMQSKLLNSARLRFKKNFAQSLNNQLRLKGLK